MAYRANLKIRFSDIDHAGIVYYPRFLHYFHVALEEFFPAELGITYPDMIKQHGIAFPTVHLETDFAKPLAFGDLMEVEVTVRKVGRTSLTWGYRVFRKGSDEVMIQGCNITVCVFLDGFIKTEVPEWLRKALTDYQARSEAEDAPSCKC